MNDQDAAGDEQSHPHRAGERLVAAGVVEDGAAAPCLEWRACGAAYTPAQRATPEIITAFGGVQLRFALPFGAQMDFVRIWPTSGPGWFRLSAVSIDGVALDDLARRVHAAAQECEDIDGVGLALYSATQRPWIELDLRMSGGSAAAGARPVVVALELGSLHPHQRVEDRVLAALAPVHAEIAKHQQQALRGQLVHTERAAALQATLGSILGAVNDQADAARSTSREAREDAHAHALQLEQRLRQQDTVLESLAAAVAALHAELRVLRDEHNRSVWQRIKRRLRGARAP